MRNILLAITLVLIVGAIWYLQGMRVSMPGAPSGSGTPVSLDGNESGTTPDIKALVDKDVAAHYPSAMEIMSPAGFINTEPFMLSDLVGKKVVLLDFWTYSCINCIRTIPYLNAWYDKYHDQGLEIVGVHTPEFEFEKDINNVQAAVEKFGIKYPVVLDSDYGTWNAYQNHYWPHEFLIDLAGYVVHDHIGEGGYAETEAEIQRLLTERAMVLGMDMENMSHELVDVAPAELSGIGSPEIYFGASRNQYLANGAPGTIGAQTFTEPDSPKLNNLYLSGTWNFMAEYATNKTAGAKIIYTYRSGKVFLVAKSAEGATIRVLQDGKPVTDAAGSDVRSGVLTVKESRLYNVIDNPDGSGTHTLELIIEGPGLETFTFTFG